MPVTCKTVNIASWRIVARLPLLRQDETVKVLHRRAIPLWGDSGRDSSGLTMHNDTRHCPVRSVSNSAHSDLHNVQPSHHARWQALLDVVSEAADSLEG